MTNNMNIKIELIRKQGSYYLSSDGVDSLIPRQIGEMEDDYKKRAINRFDDQVNARKDFWKKMFEREVIKTEYI